MSKSDTNCQCVWHANPPSGIWCHSCGGKLPVDRIPVDKPLSNPASDQALTQRRALYRQVLQDLDELQKREGIAGDTYDSIHAFYSQQLDAFECQQKRYDTERSHYKLLLTARQAAQGGKYSDAIEILGKLQHCDQYVDAAQGMTREVQHKQAEEQEAARVCEVERSAREVRSFQNEARHLIELGQIAEAKEKTSRAIEDSPGNILLAQAAAEINQRIETAEAEAAKIEQPSEFESSEEVARPDSGSNRQKEAVSTGNVPIDSQQTPELKTSLSADAHATNAETHTPPRTRFADATADVPSPASRMIDAASNWSSVIKPFLLDNVGWFVGVFLVITGFIILILTFWSSIEQNQILMHSLVYFALASATGMFFTAAYFMRRKYPQLESSSNVLLVIVALLIPLVFAAATLTSLVPVSPPNPALIETLR